VGGGGAGGRRLRGQSACTGWGGERAGRGRQSGEEGRQVGREEDEKGHGEGHRGGSEAALAESECKEESEVKEVMVEREGGGARAAPVEVDGGGGLDSVVDGEWDWDAADILQSQCPSIFSSTMALYADFSELFPRRRRWCRL
jgi:hypothetical protein